MTSLLAECYGLFGRIRIIERKSDGARFYSVNGSVQTLMLASGDSAFGYVHAIKLLLRDAQSVLMIGGAGASLATMLARRGRSVTVIDIDPAAESLARGYFGLPDSVAWLTTDPRAFIEGHSGVFDAVVIDACDTAGLVSAFRDADAIQRILLKACPAGALLLNIVREDIGSAWAARMAAQLSSIGLSVCLFRPEEGWEGNEVLHVRVSGPTDCLRLTDLDRRPAQARTYLMSLRPYVTSVGASS